MTFLLEDGAERVSCLLNPERLTVRRSAGAVPRRTLGGLLSGRGQSDDPLMASGGGVTELELELLFDTSLTEGPVRVADVRDLTRPLWRLAEGGAGGGLARVRFLWGKAWNVPGVVLAASELFEAFGVGGAPQRSWLKLRLRRVAELPGPDEPAVQMPVLPGPLSGSPLDLPDAVSGASAVVADAGAIFVHEVRGGPEGGERVDTLAWRHLGDAALWRLIAAAGAVDDPLRLRAGLRLRLPVLPGRPAAGDGPAGPNDAGGRP